MKAIRVVAACLLLVVAFMLGANHYRMKLWPFEEGLFWWTSKRDEARADQDLKNWVEKLQKGGYIIYFRHAHRDKWPAVAAFDVHEYSSEILDASQTSFKRAVCLSDQGIEEAKIIGRILQLAAIPVGTVISSPSCRAKQTATHAFGRYDFVDSALFPDSFISRKVYPELASRLKALLLKVELKPQTNTVISGHSSNVLLKELPWTGEKLEPEETGFYVLERSSDNRLVVVYAVKSIAYVATRGLDISLKQPALKRE